MSSPVMTSQASALIFSDLSKCEPAASLSRDRVPGTWRMVDYETEDGVAGTMVFAFPNEGAGELRLPIDARGCFRVHVGINYQRVPGGDLLHHSPWPVYGQVQLKLDGDTGFTRFALEVGWKVDSGWKLKGGMEGEIGGSRVGKSMQIYLSIQETFWRVHQFNGPTELTIAGMESPYSDEAGSRLANLAYIKLIPVSPEEKNSWERLRPHAETRRLAVTWCSGMLTGHAIGSAMYHPVSLDWFSDEIAPFMNTDAGVFAFECIRGNLCAYRSSIGDINPPEN
ncbi:MAG: hypothetical protein ACREIA_26505, partial [Opitutaceae bacterium]